MTENTVPAASSRPLAVTHTTSLHVSGVIIVPNWAQLPVRHIDPAKGRGIRSYIVHGYHDTKGNITQEKYDEWDPGTPGDEHATAGWFIRHGHPDMDEQFRVVSGETTFRYWVPNGDGFDAYTVEVGEGGYIYFPAGVEHEGWNSGQTLAVLCITGIRTGNTAEQDAGKGKNIPLAV